MGWIMSNYIDTSYDILVQIIKEKAYIQVALTKGLQSEKDNKATITKIVYGVVEQQSNLLIVLRKYVPTKPKAKISILLTMGIYMLLYLDGIPDYTCVDECVRISKSINGGAYSGMVNAVLRRIADNESKCKGGESYTFPSWLKQKLIGLYGEDDFVKLSVFRESNFQHVRVNNRRYSDLEFEFVLKGASIPYRNSPVGGFFVKKCTVLDNLFKDGKITYQSPSSMLTVQSMGVTEGANVLDACAAPGGKSVYIGELQPTSKIDACDLHLHRVMLIKKYAARMGVTNINAIKRSATEHQAELDLAYDFVLCDVPCSGSGVFRDKPDILLSINPNEFIGLSERQKSILDNCSHYVKVGGVLTYSTCSLLREENADIVADFLSKHKEFRLAKMDIPLDNNGEIQLLPDEDYDGFYIAKMVRMDV